MLLFYAFFEVVSVADDYVVVADCGGVAVVVYICCFSLRCVAAVVTIVAVVDVCNDVDVVDVVVVDDDVCCLVLFLCCLVVMLVLASLL